MTSSSSQNPISDNFVNLICVACEDPQIHQQLEALLALPSQIRQDVVRRLVLTLRTQKAPEEIVDAIAWLGDDTVSAQAQLVLQTLPQRK